MLTMHSPLAPCSPLLTLALFTASTNVYSLIAFRLDSFRRHYFVLGLCPLPFRLDQS